MHKKVFLATPGSGIARSEADAHGNWTVEVLLPDLNIRTLAADILNPNTVYAGTQGNGILRSKDGGRSWKPLGLNGQIVKSIAASPTIPSTIYAGTNPAAVYVSHDDGKSWHELESFHQIKEKRWWFSPAEPPFKAYVLSIALSPTDPNFILTGIEAGAVVQSIDGGKTWSGHLKGALRDNHTLINHPINGDWFYQAGGSGAGVSYSQDGGATWHQPREGLDGHYGWACAADPENPEIWYASLSPSFSWRYFQPTAHVDGAANAAIYRKEGETPWKKLSGGLPQPLDYMAYALLVDSDKPGLIYAGLSNGDVWFSENHGDSWDQLPFNLGSIQRQMVMLA